MIKAYFKVLNLAGPVNSKMNDITFFADGSMAVYVMTKLRLMLRLLPAASHIPIIRADATELK